jgi:tellurite resistance protein TerC
MSNWVIFGLLVVILLAFDLGFLHRKNREIGAKESVMLSVGYIAVGLAFGAWVYSRLGAASGMEYLTGFVIEKTLALDNIFLISLIFKYLAIPKTHQYRVLFWGIIGVIVLRGIVIGLGATIISHFEWVLYAFALFLIGTGIKMFTIIDHVPDIANNSLLLLLKQKFKITTELHGQKFWIYKTQGNNQRVCYITPLMVALILIEFIDLIFALDSVPAILAITTDTYIVYTSNIFAILGLRALYFALDAVLERFKYMKYSLALVLIFIGSKIFIADLMGLEKFPIDISMIITLSLLKLGAIYSWFKSRRE